MKRVFVLLTLLLSSLGALSAHASDKKVRIASDSTYAPFEFQNADKQYTGIDVDLITAVAKDNNWQLDQSFPGFQAALDKLTAGQVDGVIAGMSITDERKKIFDFSDPYYKSAIVIATKANSPISSYAQLKGLTVGAKNGTVAQEFLAKHEAEYGYKVKIFDEGAQMFDSLKIGDVKAIMDEAPVLQYAGNQGQDIVINMDPEPIGDYGFAVKKGSHKDLIDDFNRSLAKMKADGRYDKIVATYTSAKPTNAVKPAKSSYHIVSDSLFAPFEFQDSSKQYTGIDVDLLKAIAKKEGFKFEQTFPGFQAALDQVLAGQADGAIAGMSITDERKKVFDFSDPYYIANATLATKASDKTIKSYKDLKGKTVGVKNGTASQTFIEDNKAKYGYAVKTFDAADTMYQSLDTGSIDAFMDDEPVVKYAIQQGQKFQTPIAGEKIGEYGFAVKKGSNPELITLFNQGLAALKSNGNYDKIIASYLGSDSKSVANKKIDESSLIGIIQNNWQQLLSGLGKTLLLTVVSFLLALIIGMVFGLLSTSPNAFLRGFVQVYVDLVRGVPLMVLAIFIFYGIPNLLEILTGHPSPLNDFAAGIIALTLNASAYISEIVRSGVQAVDPGQMEASRSLGVPYVTSMRKIILPQAVKITIPSLVNQFIISLKDTTIISAIGLIELLQTGRIIVARNFQSFKVYGLIGVIYLVVILALTILARRLERKMK